MATAQCDREHSSLNAEQLAHWYLRLNGFMTMNNFVLHPDRKPWSQRTDADIFGVRYPFRQELNFVDDEPFVRQTSPHFVIAEVTRGECKLNGPWTDPTKGNIDYVLRAIGAFESTTLEDIARSLYERYCYDSAGYRIHLIAFGNRINPKYSDPKNPLLQITFETVSRFIFKRFRHYSNEKKDHQHWDRAGQTLWNLTDQHWNSEDEFVERALSAFGIPIMLP